MLFDCLADRIEALLPPAVRCAYRSCRSDATPTADLRRAADGYWHALTKNAPADAYFDHEVAARTYAGCLALIEYLASHPDPGVAEAFTAAVRCFVLEDDAIADSGLLGLDDDLAVVEATAAALGATLAPGAGQ